MIINNKNNNIEVPETINHYKDPFKLINPKKANFYTYLKDKENMYRKNGVDNEIKKLRNTKKKKIINIINEMEITEEEYNKSIEIAEELLNELKEDDILEICSYRRLVSVQRYLM